MCYVSKFSKGSEDFFHHRITARVEKLYTLYNTVFKKFCCPVCTTILHDTIWFSSTLVFLESSANSVGDRPMLKSLPFNLCNCQSEIVQQTFHTDFHLLSVKWALQLS